MGVGVRGRIAGSAAGVPGCQRMSVSRQGPRGTPGHSGTRSTGFWAWLTKRMEAADRSGGGGELQNHFTPAAHGLQSAPPSGRHQGRYALPDAHRWDETKDSLPEALALLDYD